MDVWWELRLFGPRDPETFRHSLEEVKLDDEQAARDAYNAAREAPEVVYASLTRWQRGCGQLVAYGPTR